MGAAVRDIASLGEITPARLREEFPQWRIFPADGRWWAVRGGKQEHTGPASLLLCAVTAPDIAALAGRLCAQEWLDSLDAAALEAVYRGTRKKGTR